jgi:hypothetical protein
MGKTLGGGELYLTHKKKKEKIESFDIFFYRFGE